MPQDTSREMLTERLAEPGCDDALIWVGLADLHSFCSGFFICRCGNAKVLINVR